MTKKGIWHGGKIKDNRTHGGQKGIKNPALATNERQVEDCGGERVVSGESAEEGDVGERSYGGFEGVTGQTHKRDIENRCGERPGAETVEGKEEIDRAYSADHLVFGYLPDPREKVK